MRPLNFRAANIRAANRQHPTSFRAAVQYPAGNIEQINDVLRPLVRMRDNPVAITLYVCTSGMLGIFWETTPVHSLTTVYIGIAMAVGIGFPVSTFSL